MNTSFASQLVGFILTNGAFESDPTAPRFDAFVVKSEGVSMKIWQPREGWMHLTVIVGDCENGTHYHYCETLETVGGWRNYASRNETLSIATPDKYGDYELTTIQSNYCQKGW